MNPERVELVRLRLGLTKQGFAKALGVDRKVLQRFEGGAQLPDQCITKLCELSGFPLAFFDRETPEYPNAQCVSFRSLRSLTAGPRNAAIAAGALAFEIDDWITERYELPAHSLVQTETLSPSEAAAFVRSQWGIGVRPITNVINLLEAHGVRVFSLVEDTRHLDAYSLWRNDKPYVFLNTLKTTERMRFDALHELAHLTMHRHSGSSHPDAEREANAFASAFLMPPEDLTAEIPWVRSLGELVAKKKRWGVSLAALCYALNKTGKITDWHYKGYCIEIAKFGRDIEPNPMPPETSQVWTKILSDLWGQGIDLSRLAQRIGVPEHQLNNLLFGIAAAHQAERPVRTLRIVN
jgi:Zn-dependent peptidase ImmA (M78 family)/DNA-binding XRE family transcriptional regulator